MVAGQHTNHRRRSRCIGNGENVFKAGIFESSNRRIPANIPVLLKAEGYDVILLDMNFKKGVNDGEEGIYWLQQILKIDPHAVVVLITAYGEVDLAVKAMKNGAVDFV